jgi:TonB family protein
MKEPMPKSAILAFLVLVVMLNATPLLAQSGESSSVTKPSTERTWTLSELDTLSGHKWVWRDKSFKEEVRQPLDTLPDKMPYLKKKSTLECPYSARRQEIEADVEIRVLVDKNGKAQAAYIFRDSGHEGLEFEEAALKSVRSDQWEPAYLHGSPIPAWVTYVSRFRLLVTSEGDPVTKVSLFYWTIGEKESLSDTSSDFLSKKNPGKFTADDTEEPTFPVAVKLCDPIYPLAASRSGAMSSVWVRVLVGTNGKVMEAAVSKLPVRRGLGFEEAALKSAINGRWKPATHYGKPTATWVSYEIKFSGSGQ